METPGIIFVVISAIISFGIGRLFVYFRDKKRNAAKVAAEKRAALVLKDQPPEPESRNKAKRKRQLRESNRDGSN
jgi:hypothetical protein